MEPKRIGRQTPTTSLVLPYKKTKGKEAVEIYNKTGRTALGMAGTANLRYYGI